MRHEASVTSISWIPSEAMTGPLRVPVDMGIGHYDPPPPDEIGDLDELGRSDRFRFANHLAAFVEVEGDRVVDAGYIGGGHVGATTLRVGKRAVTIPAVAYPDLQAEPVVTDTGVRFEQTSGGRTGAPLPRRISKPPFIQITAPTAWTTLGLTIHKDGAAEFDVIGASPFPRHWFYDSSGALVRKSGIIDFADWAANDTHDHSPWHGVNRPALVADAESALERAMSVGIMSGSKPHLANFAAGQVLIVEGDPGDDVYLILDGTVEVSVGGDVVAEAGPGSIIGERAAIEGGVRTSTVTASSVVRVAVAQPGALDESEVRELAEGHRREEL
jgi:Cyclic nucleotide-binding domain